MKLKTYATVIHAIDPATEELMVWCGPVIQDVSQKQAQRQCIDNDMGYLIVVGEIDQTPQTEAALMFKWENREN